MEVYLMKFRRELSVGSFKVQGVVQKVAIVAVTHGVLVLHVYEPDAGFADGEVQA